LFFHNLLNFVDTLKQIMEIKKEEPKKIAMKRKV
jgi:hypothetical protein